MSNEGLYEGMRGLGKASRVWTTPGSLSGILGNYIGIKLELATFGQCLNPCTISPSQKSTLQHFGG